MTDGWENPERERALHNARRCKWARADCRNDHLPGSNLCREHAAEPLFAGPPRPSPPPRPCVEPGCGNDAAQPNARCLDHVRENRDRAHLQRLVGAKAPIVEVIDAEGTVYEIAAPTQRPARPPRATTPPARDPEPSPTCSVNGCDRPRRAKGKCMYHYQLARVTDPTRPRCSVEGCDTPTEAKGMCARHRAEVRNRANGIQPRPPRPPCSEPDCSTPSRSRGLCLKHYSAERRRRARASASQTPTERNDP